MSQENLASSGHSSQREFDDDQNRASKPEYMTFGTGSISESAKHLTEMLDDDSGYGTRSSNLDSLAWDPSLMSDHFVSRAADGLHSEQERHTTARSIFQLQYNRNRTALARAITRTIKALQELQEENHRSPVHYPSVQLRPHQTLSQHLRPGLVHTQSSHVPSNGKANRPQALHRAETSLGHDSMEESSKVAEERSVFGPRLVTSQLARDFSVLKIDLKMDGVPQTDIIHSMQKDSKALAQLLDGQILKSIRHLSLLRERIEDTSSKVLVTGDLNAGKSTFCNALLRRKILPEDEQPCTSIFCEVLDVRENGDLEEVHAVKANVVYDRQDERAYDVFPLSELEKYCYKHLAKVNQDVAQEELDRVTKKLEELEPLLEQSSKARSEIRDALDTITEDVVADTYSFTRDSLKDAITKTSERRTDVQYPGIWYAYAFAEDITTAILADISCQVEACEDYARARTSQGVDTVRAHGKSYLGDDYVDLKFQPENMLRRRKDTLARQVHISIEVWDFVDVSSLWSRQERVAGTSMAVTIAGVVGTQMIHGPRWINGALSATRVLGSNKLQTLLIPGIVVAFALGVSYAITSIPTSLPRRLSAKVASQLSAIDFTHSNAQRISSEVRKVLKIPADHLRIGLQRTFEGLQNQREQTGKICTESKVARKYFGNLVRSSEEIRSSVQHVELEGPAPGIAGGSCSFSRIHAQNTIQKPMAPVQQANFSIAQVLRFSALGFGVFYGLTHQMSLNSASRANAVKREYEHKNKLIEQAKAEFTKKNLPADKTTAGGSIITDPEDPKFDLEAFLNLAAAGQLPQQA
ncbi:hypothetical protein FH972_023996 [Carpinus fangiana]|uniref:Dynamin N-terminal domain-containing protein n=1 Tax=Carpinus fangiana TaxID=176857 RepID=A0A5N6KWS1_9ROSI|nr:hypothetical protein FH972_023996 [Carpinus fangiana]